MFMARMKVIHVNNMKKYMEREECVLQLTVVAEEESVDRLVRLKERCKEYREDDIKRIKDDFSDVLSELPVSTEIIRMVITLVMLIQ